MLVITLFFALPALSDGVADPQDKINAFVAPLKDEGLKGLDSAMEAAGLEQNKFYVEAAKSAGKEIPSNDQFKNSLRESLNKHGKVLAIRSTEVDERLNGNIKRYTIELEFFDGAKKRVKFQFIRPTLDGDYKLMKSEFLNY